VLVSHPLHGSLLASKLHTSGARGMARRTSGPKKKLRRGLWSPEEDDKLVNHIAKYGHGCWSSVPKLAGSSGIGLLAELSY
jgi:transcription factor MYB, plant